MVVRHLQGESLCVCACISLIAISKGACVCVGESVFVCLRTTREKERGERGKEIFLDVLNASSSTLSLSLSFSLSIVLFLSHTHPSFHPFQPNGVLRTGTGGVKSSLRLKSSLSSYNQYSINDI
jgi:hypothetical protein